VKRIGPEEFLTDAVFFASAALSESARRRAAGRAFEAKPSDVNRVRFHAVQFRDDTGLNSTSEQPGRLISDGLNHAHLSYSEAVNICAIGLYNFIRGGFEGFEQLNIDFQPGSIFRTVAVVLLPFIVS